MPQATTLTIAMSLGSVPGPMADCNCEYTPPEARPCPTCRAKKRAEPMIFCVMCFADSEGGSWGDSVVSDDRRNTHCFNCGSGGSGITMPRWAVEEIRRNASWVGKRYYANDEDRELQHELQLLRALVTDFPGRKAEPSTAPGNEGCWVITQQLGPGKSVSIMTKAASAEEALEWARLRLPYVPTVN